MKGKQEVYELEACVGCSLDIVSKQTNLFFFLWHIFVHKLVKIMFLTVSLFYRFLLYIKLFLMYLTYELDLFAIINKN